MDTENNDRHDYASSSSTTLSNRPKLVIEYSTSADVPEEWTDRTYTYSLSQPHAVIADSTGASYGYDNNGNMLHREEGGKQYTQSYNAEHQLTQVALWNNQTLLATWNFFNDGDGNRVRQEYFEGAFGQNVTVKVTNYYAGGTYELDQAGVVQANGSISIAGTITRKYYAFAGQTVAMVECSPQGCGSGLRYFLTDHLGSVAAVVNASGGLISQQRYYPYGGVRSDVGTVTQTDFGYTGQRNLDAEGNSYRLGLMDYKARFYDAYLHRFIQPDTLTAGGPQGLNRYSYSNNNPINYNDPTGHCVGAGGHEFEDGSPACNPVASEGYGDPCAEAGYTGINYGICQLDESAQAPKKNNIVVQQSIPQNNDPCAGLDPAGVTYGICQLDKSAPKKNTLTITPEQVGGLEEWGTNLWGLAKASGIVELGKTGAKVDMVVGFFLDSATQVYQDWGKYSLLQTASRAGVVAAEAYLVNEMATIGFVIGEAVGGGPEEPSADIMGVLAYIGIAYKGAQISKRFNETYAFPAIDNLP